MFKAKLVKAAMLGLCMSALTTGVAFAQMQPSSEPVKGQVLSEEENKLYDKQLEIDRYLFADHADEMAKLDFTVNYTGVNGDVVEIGISPYSDKNANYLYDIFGKDDVKVIEADQNVLYTMASSSGVAEPGVAVDAGGTDAVDPAAGGAATDVQPLDDKLYTTTAATDTAVSDVNDSDKAPDAPVNDGRMYKGSDGQVQTAGATNDAANAADDTIYYATSASSEELNPDVKTVAAVDNMEAVKRNADENSGAVSASVIVLAIAGGAAVVGGSIIAANKKKAGK